MCSFCDVVALSVSTFFEEFNGAARITAGDAESVSEGAYVELHDFSRDSRCSKSTADGSRLKAAHVELLRIDGIRYADCDIVTKNDRGEDILPGRTGRGFGDGKRSGWHDAETSDTLSPCSHIVDC